MACFWFSALNVLYSVVVDFLCSATLVSVRAAANASKQFHRSVPVDKRHSIEVCICDSESSFCLAICIA